MVAFSPCLGPRWGSRAGQLGAVLLSLALQGVVCVRIEDGTTVLIFALCVARERVPAAPSYCDSRWGSRRRGAAIVFCVQLRCRRSHYMWTVCAFAMALQL